MEIHDKGLELLVYAVVKQALIDWQILDRGGTIRGKSKTEITKFFRGGWFALLCPNLDGEIILQELKSKRVPRQYGRLCKK